MKWVGENEPSMGLHWIWRGDNMKLYNWFEEFIEMNEKIFSDKYVENAMSMTKLSNTEIGLDSPDTFR